MHRVHLVDLLPDAEDLLQEEKDELLLVLLVQLTVALLLQRVCIGPAEVGNAGWRLAQLHLRQLVYVNAGDHRILVLVELAFERHELELGIQHDRNESVGQHSDLVPKLVVRALIIWLLLLLFRLFIITIFRQILRCFK